MTRVQFWAEATENTTIPLEGAKILVVEDDNHLLKGLRNIMELDKYEILTAENGVDALDVLNSQVVAPDLILSDIMMPYMDGIEFLEHVRQNRRWVSIPFVFLTALGEYEHVKRGKELGVEDYISKPYDPDILRSVVRGRLRRSWMLNNHFAAIINDLKFKILTILNHEFRTPLTFVRGYTDLLTMSVPTPEELPIFINGVASGAVRMQRLIENFILLIDLELNNALEMYQMHKQRIDDVRPLLHDAWKDVFDLPHVEHRCEIYIEDNLPSFIGHEEYLRGAMKQLLDNAAKFTKDPNKIIKMGARRWSDREIALWVEDQGCGIPEAELQNILQAFYQIDREHTEQQGAGSGLAIVNGITQLHGGRILIESAPNEGSAFYILLPIYNG